MEKLNLFIKIIILSSAFLISSFSNYTYAQTILYGDSIALGNGVVRTWVQVDALGKRERIGVSMTDGVLNNLDTVRRLFVMALPVPAAGDDTLFNHVFFGWNPVGHGPPGVWDDPHFDFHFVTVSRAEREAVIPGPDSVLLPQYTPTDHFYDPVGAVPFHATHWADSTDPAFHSGPFTKTLIYGFYRGKIFFYEPMITRAYLLTNPNDLIPIKQPANYWRTAKFPLNYSITHNASNQTYDIFLRDLHAEIVLPVELSSFSSLVDNRNVQLNWTTASEENNSGFEVERTNVKGQTSNDWRKIGYVNGNGSTNSPSNYEFIDKNLSSGKYKFRLKQIDYNGNYSYYDLQNEVVIGTPEKYSLSQNYPNPFNPNTVISYQLAVSSIASLKVYDVLGNEVATLVNEKQNAGYYTVDFDARNNHGYNFSSGVYFYKLAVDGNVIDTKRMVLLK